MQFVQGFYIESAEIQITHAENNHVLERVEDNLRFQLSRHLEYRYQARNASVNIEGAELIGPSKMRFDWSAQCPFYRFPNYEFQLLRLYNTSANDNYLNTNRINASVDWSQALTIETQADQTFMELTISEGEGYYVWRVRPIGDFYPGNIANDKNWGIWSSTGLANDHVDMLKNAFENHDSRFYFNSFDYNYNWIHSRTFTEGGRIGETIQYANGIGHAVQSQSVVSSQSVKVVQQNLFDYSGRTVGSSLHTPAGNTVLGYKTGFLQNDNQETYTSSDFDSDNNRLSPGTLHGLVDDYYSSNNPEPVPSASGHGYSRVLFHADGKNRPKQSGSIGEVHRIQPPSVAKNALNFISQASSEELIKVFGDEAPADGQVWKTITRDENGLVSLQYLNAKGQKLATCLSHSQSSDSLVNSTYQENNRGFTIPVNGSIDVTGMRFSGTTSFELLEPGSSITLSQYRLSKQAFHWGCDQAGMQYCSTCEYSVSVELRGVDLEENTISFIQNGQQTDRYLLGEFMIEPDMAFDRSCTSADTMLNLNIAPPSLEPGIYYLSHTVSPAGNALVRHEQIADSLTNGWFENLLNTSLTGNPNENIHYFLEEDIQVLEASYGNDISRNSLLTSYLDQAVTQGSVNGIS
ncbi:MAG TPA: hypothetical protein EYN64_00245, partial [Flavobacteriales bacterium]|nr:hypothetical protein [Flavobacteriales bacterium]